MTAGKSLYALAGLALLQPLPADAAAPMDDGTSALAAPSVLGNAYQDAPLFAEAAQMAMATIDQIMADGINVPVPKDPGGGETHEQHKRNYAAIYQAGQLYRITKDRKYADFARDMLLAYADLYPTLSGDHPASSNQYSGRLFWQVLNDAVWLVNAIQGYDAIRASLNDADRQRIDDDVFRRAAEFLSTQSAATFSRIHNHATWATAGVGMTGYVLGDRDLVERALMGLDKSGKTGFLRQTDLLFSPDGYYAEGPYYQRYALLPFMVFADAIDKNEPERKIFERRDGVLLKALYTSIQLTYNGYFFPFNDAIRDKSLRTDELYQGVAIAYARTLDPQLLSIAQWQGRTVLTDGGLQVARSLAAGKAQDFAFKSLLLRDGADGDLGAVALLRNGSGPQASVLIAKNSSQGMGHGHFDKLSWQSYQNGSEIVTDYGAARFLNIVAKQGGRYLPENESWAKQTVAHNSIVVDETSHFGGDADFAETISPQQLHYSDTSGSQVSAARVSDIYPGVTATRTMAMLDIKGLAQPVMVDVMRVDSPDIHQFDLPLHYQGHIMRLGFKPQSYVQQRPVLGTKNGYQHIWVDARGRPQKDEAFITWMTGNHFYSWRYVAPQDSETILAQSGANDPDFNLRREPMLIQRVTARKATFVGLLESHGLYDGAAERTVDSDSLIKTLQHAQSGSYDLVYLETLAGARSVFAISYDPDPKNTHQAMFQGALIKWTGFAARIDLPDVQQP